MRRFLVPVLLALIQALAVRAGEETNRAGGGSAEELRAVLELDSIQAGRVQTLYRDADGELQQLRTGARQRNGAVTIEQLVGWQTGLRQRVKDVLHPNQLSLYEAWLEKKRRLGEEYDKSLFGVPNATELKLKLGFAPDTLEKVHGIADQAVVDIRRKMSEMRAAGQSVSSIGDAVNELRKEAVKKMGEAASSAEKRKFTDYLKTWVRIPAEKLSRPEGDRLDRIMKQLELADGAVTDRIQSLVSAVLWHQEENATLRRGLGKELLMTLLQKRPESEVWTAIYEYGTLFDIHNRRIKALREDLKALLPTKQIAKLVAEGVLE
ncbi:MAG: hypothetical protein FD180_1457 [Planctomycetota bacterium]|nr:MAG: hypothetical protein FD180_1457 [Planctomycetota bacterium]